MHRWTRRGLFLGGAGVLAAGGTVALDTPVRSRLRRDLGIGQVQAAAPSLGAPEPRYATFTSTARAREVTWGWAAPAGADPAALPVLLVLHGRGDDARTTFASLAAHEFLAAHVAAGGSPLAVVSVDGGETYWHPRSSGGEVVDDPLAMIDDELAPRLADAGLRLERWAVAGWSTGGFGALLVARESAAGRLGGLGELRSAAAGSPALFDSAGASAAGAFDDAANWAEFGDLVTDPGTGTVALEVSCGRDDPFRSETQRYREACDPVPAGGIGDGAHTFGYWRSLVPGWLRFSADALR